MRLTIRRRLLLLTMPVILLASSATVFVSVGAASANSLTITVGQLKSGQICLPPSTLLKNSKPLCFPISSLLPARVKAESNRTSVRCVLSGFYLFYQGYELTVEPEVGVDNVDQAMGIFESDCHI